MYTLSLVNKETEKETRTCYCLSEVTLRSQKEVTYVGCAHHVFLAQSAPSSPPPPTAYTHYFLPQSPRRSVHVNIALHFVLIFYTISISLYIVWAGMISELEREKTALLSYIYDCAILDFMIELGSKSTICLYMSCCKNADRK
jgi:hypothetical protein